MWLGLIYLPELDDAVILCAWSRGGGRPFTVTGARGSVVETARALRLAHRDAAFVVPRCDECGAPHDLPEL